MPQKIQWTKTADNLVTALRAEGQTWDAIAARLGVSRNSVLNRVKCLASPGFQLFSDTAAEPRKKGVEETAATQEDDEKAERPPLPPGHPLAWGLLTRGTILEGLPYPLPGFYEDCE
ncbi:MAG: AsnC family protein [Acidobacteriia bacterium]|nr:AsnC family protein [Methyloceanibacter sp.]MBX5471470.1 AsnC family protein [Acetobacteraceae bacterium]MCL6492991.1 AsnC family protein [Terriglobia bacterium]